MTGAVAVEGEMGVSEPTEAQRYRVLVIEPGHGSTWLDNAYFHNGLVTGEGWDDSGRGSAQMPDDYRGEPITLTYPRSHVLRALSPEPVR